MGYQCTCAGMWHDERPTCFGATLPAPVAALAQHERAARAAVSSDQCILSERADQLSHAAMYGGTEPDRERLICAGGGVEPTRPLRASGCSGAMPDFTGSVRVLL